MFDGVARSAAVIVKTFAPGVSIVKGAVQWANPSTDTAGRPFTSNQETLEASDATPLNVTIPSIVTGGEAKTIAGALASCMDSVAALHTLSVPAARRARTR